MVGLSGVLNVWVVKGSNLAIRDHWSMSSDPYVVVTLGKHKEKTCVKESSLNPIWDEDLKFDITNVGKNDRCSLIAEVWDKDKFPKLKRDDFMGVAEIDIKPLLQALHPIANGKKIVAKSSNNCLDKDCFIVDQRDGRIVQEACLKLGNVESGLLDLRLEWQPGLI